MKALDHLTAAFECLWEAKVHVLRADAALGGTSRAEMNELVNEVAATRNRVEKMLIALQEQRDHAGVRPPG